ncbi:MAG: hypothetical protein IT529_09140 [Burkholderiales bacterium]|nr:hypothetical protein [Burkholderiales bacterium]
MVALYAHTAAQSARLRKGWTGIRTEVVIERFSAGEPLEVLAEDYGRSKEDIEEVLRSELQLAA